MARRAASEALYGLSSVLHTRDLIVVGLGIGAAAIGRDASDEQTQRREALRTLAEYTPDLREHEDELTTVLAALMPRRDEAQRDRLWDLIVEAVWVLVELSGGRPVDQLMEIPAGVSAEQAREHLRGLFQSQLDSALTEAVAR